MTQQNEFEPVGLSPCRRLLLAAAGAALLAGLAVAASLEPDPRGVGTHQRLGLPACTFKELFGIRCPSCGMTTSWAWFMRGRVGTALGANVGGTLLAALAIMAGPWLLAAAVRGRWLGRLPSDKLLVAVALTVVFVTLIDWGVRLAGR